MDAFQSVTKLAAIVGILFGLFKMVGGDNKQGVKLIGLTVLFLMVPGFIEKALAAPPNPNQFDALGNRIGGWYGGGTTAQMVKACLSSGAAKGQQIWDVLRNYMVPHAGLLWCGIIAWNKSVRGGDVFALPQYLLLAGIFAPMIAGGPSAAAPQAVVNGSAAIIEAVLEKNDTKKIEYTGYGTDEFQIARSSARLPPTWKGNLRPALIAYYQVGLAAINNKDPPNNDLNPLDPDADTVLADEAYDDTKVEAALSSIYANDILGVLGAATTNGPRHLAQYFVGDVDSSIHLWIAPITVRGVWDVLSSKGKLRDKKDWGEKTAVIPLGSGSGEGPRARLNTLIKVEYDAYNAVVAGKTTDEIHAMLVANYGADSLTDDMKVFIQVRATALQKANAEATKVEPPEVVASPSEVRDLAKTLRAAIVKQYQAQKTNFVKTERMGAITPSFLSNRSFYGTFLFGGDLGLPVATQSPYMSTLTQWTDRTDPGRWKAYLYSPGIRGDFSLGVGQNAAADKDSTLDDQSWFSKIFFGFTSWTGLELITLFLKIAVPFCKYVIPWVAALAFYFIMVSYPIFACTACFPGKWHVMLDWAKAVLWVMSWAVCWQLGRSWIDGGGAPLDTGNANWFERQAASNIWQICGVIVIIAAPAFTTVVLGATANAMQNIGGSLMTMGMRLGGASVMLGSLVMVAVTAGVGAVVAGPTAVAGGGAAGAAGAAGGAAGASGGAAGAGAAGAAGGTGVAGGANTMAATAMSSKGGTLSSLISTGVRAGVQAGGQAARLGSLGAKRLDTLLPNPMTGQAGGTGAGSGAGAFGPEEGRRGGRPGGGGPGGGKGGGGIQGPGVDVSRDERGAGGGRSGGGQAGLLQAAARLGGQAQAADGALAQQAATEGGSSPAALRKAEALHATAAAYSTANSGQAANHASHAAAAAVASGSRSADNRIADAERHSTAAVAAASSPGEVMQANLSAARTQIAKGAHAEAEGRGGDAQVAYGRAAGHLASAQAASAQQLATATAAGDTQGRMQQLATQGSIGAAAADMGKRSSDSGTAAQLGQIQVQVQAVVQAQAQAGGSPAATAREMQAAQRGDAGAPSVSTVVQQIAATMPVASAQPYAGTSKST